VLAKIKKKKLSSDFPGGYFIQQQRVFDSPEICILCSTMKLMYDCVRVRRYTYIQVGRFFAHSTVKEKSDGASKATAQNWIRTSARWFYPISLYTAVTYI
jgi:hypothetical protein